MLASTFQGLQQWFGVILLTAKVNEEMKKALTVES
jgi:hypothetical protein